jgi:hypothetical protein
VLLYFNLRLEIIRILNRAKIQYGLLFGNTLKNRKKSLFSPSRVGPKALGPAQSHSGFVPRVGPMWPTSKPRGAVVVEPPGVHGQTAQV